MVCIPATSPQQQLLLSVSMVAVKADGDHSIVSLRHQGQDGKSYLLHVFVSIIKLPYLVHNFVLLHYFDHISIGRNQSMFQLSIKKGYIPEFIFWK